MRYIYIGILGLVGIFLRYEFGIWTTRHLPPDFPFATLMINVIGSLLIGVVYVLAFEHGSLSIDLRTGFMVGLFGGFTTFSSYSLESVRLFETDRIGLGLAYFVLSPVLCLGASYIGLFITRLILSVPQKF